MVCFDIKSELTVGGKAFTFKVRNFNYKRVVSTGWVKNRLKARNKDHG